MKKLIVLIFTLASFVSFSQPSPQESYAEKIKVITKQLKTDSLNYILIWERLKMKVTLLDKIPTSYDIFSQNTLSIHKKKLRDLYYEELNNEFKKIYDSIILFKKNWIVEEGDFYLNRTWFYLKMQEVNKGINDAKYLRDSATYTRYWGTGDTYSDWAQYCLFNFYVIDHRYKEAVEVIDTMLQNKKRKNPEVYFSGHGSFLSYQDKIRLFEHFNKGNELITFLKENCKEHFNWYLKNKTSKDYYVLAAKEQSLYSLKLLVHSLEKYNQKEFSTYNSIYLKLSYRVNGSHETLNPNINDSELESIISKL